MILPSKTGGKALTFQEGDGLPPWYRTSVGLNCMLQRLFSWTLASCAYGDLPLWNKKEGPLVSGKRRPTMQAPHNRKPDLNVQRLFSRMLA